MEKTVVISICSSSKNIPCGIGAKIALVLPGGAVEKKDFLFPAFLCAYLLHETVRYGAGVLSKPLME